MFYFVDHADLDKRMVSDVFGQSTVDDWILEVGNVLVFLVTVLDDDRRHEVGVDDGNFVRSVDICNIAPINAPKYALSDHCYTLMVVFGHVDVLGLNFLDFVVHTPSACSF